MLNTIAAVEEYSIWGGIPRYWELRADYPDMDTAIRELALDTKGILGRRTATTSSGRFTRYNTNLHHPFHHRKWGQPHN